MSGWRSLRSAGTCGLAAAATLACAGPPPAWELPPPPPREAPVVRDGALHHAELDNGARIMVMEDSRLPLVSFGVAVPRGAAVEDEREAGAVLFTAEVMKRGAGDRDALELAEAIDELGASLSVSADWDTASVVVSGLSEDRHALVEILADVVLRPRFEAQEAASARAEQLAGLEQAVDDPGTLVNWYALRALYPDHRFGAPIEGTKESVERFDAAVARGTHSRLFVPGEAVFFASGDVSAEIALDLARDHFDARHWPAADPAPPAPAPPAQVPPARRVVLVDKPELAQSRIVVAHEGIDRRDDRRVAADIVNKVLGGSGFSSRLMQRVRSDEGLTYSIWSGFSPRRQPGPFLIATFTRVPETRRVIDLILEELARIQSEPPGEQELADAKSLAVGRFGLGLESSSAVLAALVELDLYDLPEDSLDTYRSRVRAVDVETAEQISRALFHPDRVAITVLGPADEIATQLQDLGEVEVVTP